MHGITSSLHRTSTADLKIVPPSVILLICGAFIKNIWVPGLTCYIFFCLLVCITREEVRDFSTLSVRECLLIEVQLWREGKSALMFSHTFVDADLPGEMSVRGESFGGVHRNLQDEAVSGWL